MTSPELAAIMDSLGYDCRIDCNRAGQPYAMGFRKIGERRYSRIKLYDPLPDTREGVLWMLLSRQRTFA